jgi:shikimate dehydrogenase
MSTHRKAGVIGWPVAHSRSPLIHGYWLKRYGIDGEYTRIPVKPEDVDAFFAGLAANGYAGCNVTLPHKEAAFRAVTVADAATKRLGSVNTVFLRDGKLMGTSTDGEGFVASVTTALPGWSIAGGKAVLLGAGGSARAIAGALLDRGATEIAIVNRTLARAEAIRSDFGSRITPYSWEDAGYALAGADLLVNTTSLGMKGNKPLSLDFTALPQGAVVSDIVYTPLETVFLKAARSRGHRVVPGLGMLLHQAVRGFELWFGKRPEVTQELHDLVAADIEQGART